MAEQPMKRRAVMCVGMELLAGLLDLPEGVQVTDIATSSSYGIRRDSIILRIEGEPLEPIAADTRAPYLKAVYEHLPCGHGRFVRFETDGYQED